MPLQHASGIPPLSQPLRNHFTSLKKTISRAPSSDVECNPFLMESAKSSTSLTSSKKISTDVKAGESSVIQPTFQHKLKGSRKLPLGEQQATLLSLHSAVEHALVVHLATSGGNAVDSSVPATSLIQLPSVITYATLRPIVERSCGRRLGPTELAKLMWLWGAGPEANKPGCNIGFHVTKGRTMSRAGKKSYDYFFSLQVGVDLPFDEDEEDEDGESKAQRRKRTISNDGREIPITPPRKRVRPLDLPEEPQTPSPSPRSINVFAKQSSLLTPPASPSLNRTTTSPLKGHRTRSISANSSPLASSSEFRNTLSLVAMWNSGIERRKKEVRKRLVKWTLDCYETWQRQRSEGPNYKQVQKVKEEENPFDDQEAERPCTPPPPARRAVEGHGGILTPSATREEGWVPNKKRTRDFFAGPVEEVRIKPASSLIREWDSAFPLDKVAPTPEATLPEVPSFISQKLSSQSSIARKQSAPKAVEQEKVATHTSTGVRLSLTDRIKAKEDAKRAQMDSRASIGLGLGLSEINESSEGETSIGQSRSSMMANLKRRSALSRLQDIAESLYMIFSSKASSGNSSTLDHNSSNTVIKRYPHLPINEVAKSICNSSKVAMSEVEARQSMKMLEELAPGFVEITRVGAREWVRLGINVEGEQVQAQTGGVLGAVRRKIRVEMDKN